tara:strand:- start:197 stop:334 length:138 start_codon:yes stop_codon:yes gene_type:complete
MALSNGTSSFCFISVGDEKYNIFLFKDLRIKKIVIADKKKIKNKK